MATIKGNRGTWFSVTATGTSSATATNAAVENKTHYITDIMCSSDKDAANVLVKQGTTTLWQATLDTAATGNNTISHSFQTPLVGVSNGLVSVTIDGTSSADANIAGFTLES